VTIVLAYGVPGAGKTTLLHDLVKAQEGAQLFWTVGNGGGWGPDSVQWRGKPPRNLWLLRPYDGLPDPLPEKGVLVFRGWDPLQVAELCVQHTGVYVNDELDVSARAKGWRENPIRRIVHEGRHLEDENGEYVGEAHLMGACRRPQNLHTDVSELADNIYVFRCKGHNTFTRLINDGTIKPDQVEQVEQLKDFHCWWSPASGQGQWLRIPKCGTPRGM
jgi:hypothetical protein